MFPNGSNITCKCCSNYAGMSMYNILSERKDYVKYNNRMYKPHSLGTPVGSRCNRSLVNARAKRT